MRVVVAMFKHETNTFSPVPTPWEAFGKDGPWIGREAREAVEGTRVPMAAYIDLARKAGAEIVTPVAAWAYPSGPVDGAAYERICTLICDTVRQGCDAVFHLAAVYSYARRDAASMEAVNVRGTAVVLDAAGGCHRAFLRVRLR